MAGKQTAGRKPITVATRRRPTRRWGGWLRGLRDFVLRILLLLIVVPPIWVAIYRVVPPPITILMIERLIEGQGIDHKWAPMSQIAPSMTRAVIASEDANYCDHEGFDFHAISAALRHNEARPNKVRGGSTISQQTAKNVFLWPQRSWVRKGAEAWFTVLIETLWGKRRIMEVYLNTAEMGPGIYGVESASERYFGKAAADLSPDEASRLAVILPDPLKWKVVHPGPYVQRRTGRIDARADSVARGGLAACVYGPRGMNALLGTLLGEPPTTSHPAKPVASATDFAPKGQRPDEPPYPVPYDLTSPHGAKPTSSEPSAPSETDEPSVPPPSAGPAAPR